VKSELYHYVSLIMYQFCHEIVSKTQHKKWKSVYHNGSSIVHFVQDDITCSGIFPNKLGHPPKQ